MRDRREFFRDRKKKFERWAFATLRLTSQGISFENITGRSTLYLYEYNAMINVINALDAVDQLKTIQSMRLANPAVDKRHAEKINRAVKDIRSAYDDLFREPKTIVDYDRAWLILRAMGNR